MGKKKKKKFPETSTPPPNQRTDLFWRLICLFTLSGVSGLIYQVVWSRLIVLIFGSATYAVATVLGVFFFGLALGSYLAGRYASRFSGQLALYGYLEIGVGVYAGIFFVLLSAVQGLHSLVFPLVYESEGMLTLVRIFLSGLLLLPPTIIMGATLPVISVLLTRSPRHVGQDFGIVFAYNTFGAAAGSFLSAFYLIPAFGLVWTTACGALLNIAVGMASIYWARDTDPASIEHKMMEQPVKFSGQISVGPLQAYATLIAFLVSGFLGLVYEIAWSRTLILLFGTSVYAFATMLTTYLIGLALGSLCMSRWSDRFANPLLAFAVIQIIIGSAVFVTPRYSVSSRIFLLTFSK
jgi:spermidine synthase